MRGPLLRAQAQAFGLILATALDAHARDYPLWVPADCTAAITPERKRRALQTMRDSMHAAIRTAARTTHTFSA